MTASPRSPADAGVKNLGTTSLHLIQLVLDGTRRFACIAAMRNNVFIFLTISTLAIFAGGCVGTLDSRREPGNPLAKDKLIRVYERPVMQCWAAAKDVLAANGTVFSEDVMQSTVSARVDTRTVRVKVEQIDPKMTRLTVQVRTKLGNGDLDLAGEVDKQIALRLATGQLPMSTPVPAK